MKTFNFVNSLKITCAMVTAIVIATKININFPLTAGVIVLVSMLDTKRHSLKITGKRLGASLIALSFSWLIFSFFGFNIFGLALFFVLFILLCLRANARVAIVLNVVLVVHIFTLKKLVPAVFINEFLLMILGVSIAFLFNFNTVNQESMLIKLRKESLEKLSDVFQILSLCLVNEKTSQDLTSAIKILYDHTEQAKLSAYDYLNSFYFQDDRYFVEFFTMISRQVHILRNIEKLMRHEFYIKLEVKLLKEFTEFFIICDNSFEHCDLKDNELKSIRSSFRENALPSSLKEFENRSALNQYLYELEDIISLNRSFLKKYPDRS